MCIIIIIIQYCLTIMFEYHNNSFRDNNDTVSETYKEISTEIFVQGK